MSEQVPSKELAELHQWLIDKANDSDPYDAQMFTKAMNIVGDRLTHEPPAAPDAWMAEDGRVITNAAKGTGARVRAAAAASEAFTIPLYRAAQPPESSLVERVLDWADSRGLSADDIASLEHVIGSSAPTKEGEHG